MKKGHVARCAMGGNPERLSTQLTARPLSATPSSSGIFGIWLALLPALYCQLGDLPKF